MVTQKFKELSKLLAQKTSEKKYHKQTAKVLGLLAVSTNAVEHFGDSVVSLEHLISLVDKYDEQEVFKLFTKEIGV